MHPDEIDKIPIREFGSLRVRVPVFTVGEILIVDSTGREVSGIQRKPSKWFIEYEEFTSIGKAIDRAMEIEANKYELAFNKGGK